MMMFLAKVLLIELMRVKRVACYLNCVEILIENFR